MADQQPLQQQQWDQQQWQQQQQPGQGWPQEQYAWDSGVNAAKAQDEEQKRKLQAQTEKYLKKMNGRVKMILGNALFIAASLLFLMTPLARTWLFSQFVGPGVKNMEVGADLWFMSIKVECGGYTPIEHKMCLVPKSMEGRHHFRDIGDLMCAVSDQLCGDVNTMSLTRYIIFVTFTVCVCLLLLGCLCLYTYWFGESHARTYKSKTIMCFALVPLFSGLGILTWTWFTPSLKTLAQDFSSTVAGFGALGDFVSFKETVALMHFGLSWIFACFVCVYSLSLIMMWNKWMDDHPDDPDADD